VRGIYRDGRFFRVDAPHHARTSSFSVPGAENWLCADERVAADAADLAADARVDLDPDGHVVDAGTDHNPADAGVDSDAVAEADHGVRPPAPICPRHLASALALGGDPSSALAWLGGYP
jgi:hypothetical protein